MDKTLRRVHSPSFKVQVILGLLKGDKTRNEVCSQFGIHPTQADKWKKKALAGLEQIFTDGVRIQENQDKELIEELYKQVGQQKVELDWLKKKIGFVSR